LSLEDSVGILLQCVKNGNLEAEKAKGQDVVIFIGNTGAGKSTTINYLYGCTMEQKSPKELGIKGFDKVIVVKSKKDGGVFDELMRIGHSKSSMTFMPQVEKDERNMLTYVDCPGFLDNRGAEINIANAVNIKNTVNLSKSAKVIMLINYHSLKSDRGRGLADMLKISSDLFSSTKNLIKNKRSILIGISNAPTDMDFESLREWLLEDNLEGINELKDCVFTFDPLDRKIEGGWNRNEILAKICSLRPITEKIFKTVLTTEDEAKLIGISAQIGKRIEDKLKSPKPTVYYS